MYVFVTKEKAESYVWNISEIDLFKIKGYVLYLDRDDKVFIDKEEEIIVDNGDDNIMVFVILVKV